MDEVRCRHTCSACLPIQVHSNTAPRHIRGRGILGFWYPRGRVSWNQSPWILRDCTILTLQTSKAEPRTVAQVTEGKGWSCHWSLDPSDKSVCLTSTQNPFPGNYRAWQPWHPSSQSLSFYWASLLPFDHNELQCFMVPASSAFWGWEY